MKFFWLKSGIEKEIDVKPGNGGKRRTGDFVQKLPMGIEAQATGKFMPADAPPLAPAHGQNNH